MSIAKQIAETKSYRTFETLYPGRMANHLSLDRATVSGVMQGMCERGTLVRYSDGFRKPSKHWLNRVRLNDPKAMRAAAAA